MKARRTIQPLFRAQRKITRLRAALVSVGLRLATQAPAVPATRDCLPVISRALRRHQP